MAASLSAILLALVSLFMSAYAAPTETASFYVPSLPDLHEDSIHPLKIFAGHISSDPDADKATDTDVTAHLFFVMVRNRRTADKDRVMFWFNGGPGCSSFDGLMMENGPWRTDGNGGFAVVEGGWEEYTTLVYIDQPIGTGFSYGPTDKYVTSIEQASEQLLVFLGNFYKVFPELKPLDTYLGGESYAGQYIPYFADAILESSLNIPLRGVAIGNGWMDARRQYPAYPDYLVKMGVLDATSDTYKAAKVKVDECVKELEEITDVEPVSTGKCDSVLFTAASVREKVVDGKEICLNIYDVRLDDTKPACGMNWPPDVKPITTYLDRKDVVNALHAEAHSEAWTECKGIVHRKFNEHKSSSSITVLPRVLKRIPVLIFAGDQDYICNYLGLENMITALTWNGATGLGTVNTESWTVDDMPAGTWVTSRNLTYVKIFDASHMAPFDAPNATHDMILRFMGVDFSAINEGSARIPSSVGADVKPIFIENDETESKPASGGAGNGNPEQSKAMWEAYYNAGSAALILLVVIVVLGTFIWCRIRRQRVQLPANGSGAYRDGAVGYQSVAAEEQIPLTESVSRGNLNEDDSVNVKGKGKARADETESSEALFDVGESDDDEDAKSYYDRHSPRAASP
ncbi:alpha/beta-hydrolase [Fistulina hepatica ATCC 64428]|uniref:Carboxypeptidase n=1 Tax=Fistulina hepatica ATCC 64428 TaxID=1128425 RepID=A0A0D7AK75_9AGAR|nr:alpha/beta-hydrolase [Fistulina hepatica ATCC 64428]